MMKKKQIWVYVLSGLFLITAIVILLGRSDMFTPDSAYHLKTGEWILKNKTLPTKDIYSWHPEDLTFIVHEWLYQVIIALIHKAGGMLGLTIFATICTILSYMISLRYGQTYVYGSLMSIVLILMTMSKQIMILPDNVGILIVLFNIFTILSQKLTQKKKIIITLVLSILLANIHGGMLSLNMVLLLFLGFIKWFREKAFCEDRFVLVATSFIGSVINPYGLSIYKYIGVVGVDASKYNTDYATYRFSGMIEVVIFIGLQVIIILGYMKKYNGKIILEDDICLYVAVIAMFLTYQRMVNLYTYGLLAFGLPYAMLVVQDIHIRVRQICVGLAGIVSLFCTILVGSRISIYQETADSYIRKFLISDSMLETLANTDVILYNNVDSGGYLLYEDIPVFMDGRTETYTHEYGNHEYWLEAMNIGMSPEYMDSLSYNFTHLLLRKDSYEALIYKASNDWEIKESNDNFILFTKSENNGK